MSAQFEAEKVFGKLQNTNVHNMTLGCFEKNGKVFVTKITTNLFLEAMLKRASALIGCYNSDAKLEWIVEDFKYAGIK